jgi:hypothetical protein
VPITGFALELSTNHQFVHSLNELIYVFSFGDRVGELTLSGLCFVGECPDASAGKITTLFSHYLNKRLATNLTPAKITLGDTGSSQLLGFLTGIRLDMPNPEYPIVQWVLRYSVIIDSASGAGGDGPGGLPGNPGGVTPEDFGDGPAPPPPGGPGNPGGVTPADFGTAPPLPPPVVPPSGTRSGSTLGINPDNAGGVTPADFGPL